MYTNIGHMKFDLATLRQKLIDRDPAVAGIAWNDIALYLLFQLETGADTGLTDPELKYWMCRY